VSAVKPGSRISFFREQTVGIGTILQVGDLREWNDLLQDLDFLVDSRPAAEKRVNDLLEIEKPKRQPQNSRRQHLSAFLPSLPTCRYGHASSKAPTRRASPCSNIWKGTQRNIFH